jgi:hypothetical protein
MGRRGAEQSGVVHLPAQNLSAIEALAAALRGDTITVSDRLADAAEAHGVDALVARTPAAAPASPEVSARLMGALAGHQALSAVRDRELARVVELLASGGVIPILIKGAHLAHTIYASPALRPRRDTDLVIDEQEQPAAASLLVLGGYRRAVHVRGALILGQCHFQRTDDLGVLHALDVHWRVAAPLVFRRVLPAATLRASRVALPALGAHAWGPSPPHALIIACVHLAAHHRVDPMLVWSYDIALLVRTLSEDEGATFLETAAATGINTVCASSLDRARRHFDGPALASLASRLRAQRTAPEPSARLLTATRPIDELWLDLRISDGWRERLALVREHLWPDAEYMRATSAPTGWLPLGYARRALSGARKWM